MFGRNVDNFAVCLLMLTSFCTASNNAAAQDKSTEIMESARLMVRIDSAIRYRDLKGYCEVTYDARSYWGYVARACEAGIKANVKIPEDCTPKKIEAQVAADRAQCLAMSSDEFDNVVARFPEHREQWIKMAADQGVDSEKLLDELRARLPLRYR